MLSRVAGRLLATARPEDVVARLGGDEFIVLLTNIHDLHGPGSVARRFIKSLGETMTINGQDCHIGASIGISIFPDDGDDEHVLKRAADRALYAAKAGGRNTYRMASGAAGAVTPAPGPGPA